LTRIGSHLQCGNAGRRILKTYQLSSIRFLIQKCVLYTDINICLFIVKCFSHICIFLSPPDREKTNFLIRYLTKIFSDSRTFHPL